MRHLIGLFCLASPLAMAQSMHECSEKGRSWYQAGACATPSAHDQTLRKCVTRGGAVSFQNAPCPAGTTTGWVRTTTPEYVSAETLRRQRAEAQRRDADARFLSRLAGTDRLTPRHAPVQRHDPRVAACEAAKRHRDATLRQVGLKRTFNLLRALDEQVYRACSPT